MDAGQGALPPGSTAFSIVTTRAMLFGRLPQELRNQVAYRHFYTEQLDPAASQLSLQFFSLFISYFCCLCRLEGRRKQYVQNQSERSGMTFARAHRKAKAVFQRLNRTYSAILLRYNTHNDLVYPRKLTAKQRLDAAKGGPCSFGIKAPIAPVSRDRAFLYFTSEMRFHTELCSFTEQVLRLAFTDERLQQPIAEQVNIVFRSSSFNFRDQQRESEVRAAAGKFDQSRSSLLQNSRSLAEVLVPPSSKIVMKYAASQRSPFVGSRLPGSTVALRYSRIFRTIKQEKEERRRGPSPSDAGMRSPSEAGMSVMSGMSGMSNSRLSGGGGGGAASASAPASRALGDSRMSAFEKNERDFMSETALCVFPAHHRARGGPLSPPRESVERSGLFMPGGGGGGGGGHDGADGHSFLSRLYNHDADGDGGALDDGRSEVLSVASSDDLSPDARRHSTAAPRKVRIMSGESGTFEQPAALKPRGSMATDAGSKRGSMASPSAAGQRKSVLAKITAVKSFRRETTAADTDAAKTLDELAKIAPVDAATGKEDWTRYDPVPEIDQVYQSLANGVVVSSFAIPLDILCDYGDTGILVEEA
jgi:hypothetical protein